MSNKLLSFSISSIRNLNKNLESLTDSFTKLSSGKRITKAADDAAGLAIAQALQADSATFSQAARNAGDSQSALEITDGALQQVGDISVRLSELSTQAANGTLSDDQRSALQSEYNQLTQEVQRIADTTEFNGKKLLNGDSFTTQVGKDSSANSQISVGGTDLGSLVSGLVSQNIGTQAGAQAALGKIDDFISGVAQKRGDIGAASKRIETATNNLKVAVENTESARSRIEDLDVAVEVAKKTAAQIRANTGQAILAQGNQNAASVLKLLK